ncbi:ATP-dependent zinc protease family protein [Terrabacter terrae]
MSGPAYSSTAVGWREWAGMPGIGLPWVKVKIDTGARTSSLHAADVEEFERDGRPWARFTVHPWQDSDADPQTVECPVHDRRRVRSSSGHVTRRLVVRVDLTLAGRTVPAEVTLSKRDRMGFRMLVGREALRQGYVVDPSRSYAGGRPPKEIRRRNRGR